MRAVVKKQTKKGVQSIIGDVIADGYAITLAVVTKSGDKKLKRFVKCECLSVEYV